MKKLRKVTVEIDISTSKENVWDLLFNRFGEVNLFNPLIDGSHHSSGKKGEVGCERECAIDAKHTVREKITAARGNESFDIDIIEGGLPMMDEMKATIDLKALHENSSRVMFTMSYNTKPAFMGALMKGMMTKMLNRLLIGLKYHLETGKLVTKENIKFIARSYNNLNSDHSFGVTPQTVLAD
jgi:hypothetical protein